MLKLIAFVIIAFQLSLGPAQPPEIWADPIPDFETRHSWDYQLPATEYGPGHRGIDLDMQENEQIRAPFDGVVSFVGKVVDRRLITLPFDRLQSQFRTDLQRIRTGRLCEGARSLGLGLLGR